MNKNELAQMHEYVDEHYVLKGRSELPQDQSKEFYEGYSHGIQQGMKLLTECRDSKLISNTDISTIIPLFGGFLIASGEKTIE